MSIPILIFIVVYMATTIAYLFSETSGNFKRRAINKICLASMFLIYATYATIRHGNLGVTLQSLCLIGVFFCFVGDVWLLWSFSKGGFSFALGNVILFAYEIMYFKEHGLKFSQYWFFIIPLVILIGVQSYLIAHDWYDMEKEMKMAFPFYLLSVSLHGTLSLVGLIYLHDVKSLLLLIGLILFMISDYFIVLHKFKFKDSKLVLRCNSFSYFTGLMLVALSFSF